MNEQLNIEAKKALNVMYNEALSDFDVATCEAVAVSQTVGVQMADAHIGHATYVFTRLCNHAVSMILATPRSRWARADFQHWDFGAVAGHARAILEGYLLFLYLIEKPESQEQWSAKINVIFMNDCTRRIKMMTNLGDAEQVKGLSEQADELRSRLNTNPWFLALPQPVQKRCLAGDNMTIPSRDEMLERAGWDKKHFYTLWDLLSQYAHALPMSFIRTEANGRGSGLENDVDKAYIAQVLALCAECLAETNNFMVSAFPDAANARKGLKSKFSPGPRSNLPKGR